MFVKRGLGMIIIVVLVTVALIIGFVFGIRSDVGVLLSPQKGITDSHTHQNEGEEKPETKLKEGDDQLPGIDELPVAVECGGEETEILLGIGSADGEGSGDTRIGACDGAAELAEFAAYNNLVKNCEEKSTASCECEIYCPEHKSTQVSFLNYLTNPRDAIQLGTSSYICFASSTVTGRCDVKTECEDNECLEEV
jgi:hypothetical protein